MAGADGADAAPRGGGWQQLLLRVLVLSGGWWILTEGASSAFVFGIPVIAAASLVGVGLRAPAPPRWHLPGLARFAGFFLVGSLRGGLAVAAAALAPRVRISPTVERHQMRLPRGSSQALFLAAVNLMPGTLSVRVDGQTVWLHVLLGGREALGEIERLERRVAAAMGLQLPPRSDVPHA